MFKIDQFTAANEAAIDQYAKFATMQLANLEKFAQLGLGAGARTSSRPATRRPSPARRTCTRSSPSTPPPSSRS